MYASVPIVVKSYAPCQNSPIMQGGWQLRYLISLDLCDLLLDLLMRSRSRLVDGLAAFSITDGIRKARGHRGPAPGFHLQDRIVRVRNIPGKAATQDRGKARYLIVAAGTQVILEPWKGDPNPVLILVRVRATHLRKWSNVASPSNRVLIKQ